MIREAWTVSSHTSEEILVAKTVEVKSRNCEQDLGELLLKNILKGFLRLLFILTYFYTSLFF